MRSLTSSPGMKPRLFGCLPSSGWKNVIDNFGVVEMHLVGSDSDNRALYLGQSHQSK